MDEIFSERHDIEQVTLDTEKEFGYDRIFISKKTGKETKIEYKTDLKAGSTGNAFLETMSRVEHDKTGWVWSTQADLVLYFVPLRGLIYIFKPDRVREAMEKWQAKYREGKCYNPTYHSVGTLVPLGVLERVCEQTYRC